MVTTLEWTAVGRVLLFSGELYILGGVERSVKAERATEKSCFVNRAGCNNVSKEEWSLINSNTTEI